jgi:hypothetical protein
MIVVTGPKALEFHDDFSNYRATLLKADILSVTMHLRAETDPEADAQEVLPPIRAKISRSMRAFAGLQPTLAPLRGLEGCVNYNSFKKSTQAPKRSSPQGSIWPVREIRGARCADHGALLGSAAVLHANLTA